MKPKMSVKFNEENKGFEISFTEKGINYKRRLLFFDENKELLFKTLEAGMSYKELIKLFEEKGEKEKVFDQHGIEIID